MIMVTLVILLEEGSVMTGIMGMALIILLAMYLERAREAFF